jgi:hypothetical protein
MMLMYPKPGGYKRIGTVFRECTKKKEAELPKAIGFLKKHNLHLS